MITLTCICEQCKGDGHHTINGFTCYACEGKGFREVTEEEIKELLHKYIRGDMFND